MEYGREQKQKAKKYYVRLKIQEIISTSFLNKDVFHKFFISPELLVGYYLWRGNGLANDGGDAEYYFELEYDGWTDDCKDIVSKAKIIFKNQMIC